MLKEPAGLDCLLLSYSGSVDSTLLAVLAVLAQGALNEKVKCILFDAPIVPRRAVNDAVEIASKFGLFQSNTPLACCGDGKLPREPLIIRFTNSVFCLLTSARIKSY
ncbi:hypothetical protein BGV40_00480 [Methanosarcina sp. Ant1]|nr:hypothetical protein BGV40_00480 [Methanosarcina sp. Ant1]